MYLSVIHTDGSQTETYTSDDNNGHQATTIYEYNATGEQISLREDDILTWIDESNDSSVTHTKETLHTLTSNTDGTQTEVYSTNEDGQVTSLTYSYNNTGAIVSLIELQADGSQTETYTTDDNNGHQTTTIYDYNANGEQISLREDDVLTWVDNSNVTHFKETLHTLVTNTNGTKSEVYFSNEDGVITTVQYEDVIQTNTTPFDANVADVSFNIIESNNNYVFNIENFGVGDNLFFSNNAITPTISNLNTTDNEVDVIYTDGAIQTTIHLTGISPMQDASISDYDTFLTTFSPS